MAILDAFAGIRRILGNGGYVYFNRRLSINIIIRLEILRGFMGYLKWNNRYSVHVDEIDKQHQKLINLINEMYDAMQAGKAREIIGTVIDEFVDYTVYHFNTEERLLQQHSYPKYDVHKEMHDNIAKKARDLRETLKKGNKPSNIDVMLLLTNWLNAHILEEDKKYAPYIESKTNL